MYHQRLDVTDGLDILKLCTSFKSLTHISDTGGSGVSHPKFYTWNLNSQGGKGLGSLVVIWSALLKY